jgi:hypothetical protein
LVAHKQGKRLFTVVHACGVPFLAGPQPERQLQEEMPEGGCSGVDIDERLLMLSEIVCSLRELG